MLLILTALSLAIWLFLLLIWGNFWRCDQRLDETAEPQTLADYPAVGIVIPARDEADVIEQSLGSLLEQSYPGPLSIVLVDDQSRDGTGEIAQRLSAKQDRTPVSLGDSADNREALGLGSRLSSGHLPQRSLTVLPGQPLAEGWTGKLWALKQGIAEHQLIDAATTPKYILFTDADIAHGPRSLERLVVKAETEQLDLVSLMVQLRCESDWERRLIPAFIFFFQKLYPFPWVNQPSNPMAAAAGGCILVRSDRLSAIGGIDCVRDALIDDCSLGAAVKRSGGKLWLGLSQETISLRPYPNLETIWNMVARTAYTQLYYSPLLLVGTVLGMGLVYLTAPIGLVVGLISGNWHVAGIAGLTWLLMAIAYAPTLSLYGQPAWKGLGLPAIATLYSLMTLDSARRHWQGKGGQWKGRSYAQG